VGEKKQSPDRTAERSIGFYRPSGTRAAMGVDHLPSAKALGYFQRIALIE
jgi:hypothetical protein